MARPDGRIEKGQRLGSAISARAWNRAQQAADVVLGAQPGFSAEGAGGSLAPYTWVYAKNATGSTVNRWGVLAITGMEIAPTGDANAAATKQFETMPVLTGGTPTADTKAWCVAVEPIENNKVGRVALAGVVQVKLNVTADGDTFAACTASSAELKTGTKGEAAILWKQSGTGGGKWGLVRFGSAAGGEEPRLGTISATWTKGSTATVTQIKADGSAISPTVTFTARNWFATVTVASGTKKVLCAFVGDQWLLLAAEC